MRLAENCEAFGFNKKGNDMFVLGKWNEEFRDYRNQALQLAKENKLKECDNRISSIKDIYMEKKVRWSVAKCLAKKGNLTDAQTIIRFMDHPNVGYRKIALALTKNGFFQKAEQSVNLIGPEYMGGRGSDDASYYDSGDEPRAWEEIIKILIKQHNYRQARRWLPNLKHKHAYYEQQINRGLASNRQKSCSEIRYWSSKENREFTIEELTDEMIEMYALNRVYKEMPNLKAYGDLCKERSHDHYYKFNELPLEMRLRLLKEHIIPSEKDNITQKEVGDVLDYLVKWEYAKIIVLLSGLHGAHVLRIPKEELD